MSGTMETGEKIFFADAAHFRADAKLRGKWVLRGEPALVDSSSPRYGEKASYYSAVCLETGEVEWMELEGNSNSVTSAAFLAQLRERHGGGLNVIWDNAPAHRGEAVREYLRTPGLRLRLVNLPGYRPGPQCRRGGLGLGERGGHRKPLPRDQGPGSGESRKLPPQAVQQEEGGQAPLSHRPATKGRRVSARIPAPFPTHGKCTSHLGFSLGC